MPVNAAGYSDGHEGNKQPSRVAMLNQSLQNGSVEQASLGQRLALVSQLCAWESGAQLERLVLELRACSDKLSRKTSRNSSNKVIKYIAIQSVV